MSILAGQEVTADELNALGNRIATATTASAADTSAETVIATYVIPANDPSLTLNGGYELHLWGEASCTGTPSLIIRARMGSVSGTNLGQFTNTCQDNGSNMSFNVRMGMMITASGSSGTFDDTIELISVLASATTAWQGETTRGASIDTTGSVTIVITATWSAASASNVCTADIGSIDRI